MWPRVPKEAAGDLRVLHVAVKADGGLAILDGKEGGDEDGGQHAQHRAENEKRIELTHDPSPP